MHLPTELNLIVREKLNRCGCDCDECHSGAISSLCCECGKQFCRTCEENGCIIQHRGGKYCFDCERGMRFDDFGNVVSKWGCCVDCGEPIYDYDEHLCRGEN